MVTLKNLVEAIHAFKPKSAKVLTAEDEAEKIMKALLGKAKRGYNEHKITSFRIYAEQMQTELDHFRELAGILHDRGLIVDIKKSTVEMVDQSNEIYYELVLHVRFKF